MSVGCPVITTKNSSLPEVCGDAALYIDPNDESSLAQAILYVDRNEVLRNDLRRTGLLQTKKFSWEKSAEILISNLRRICSGNN
jgi:glycosyltransferase involved in cell wall biosynthesis